jgi:formate dehydrogenase
MLAGYAGDVWAPQPPAADHPWRKMPYHGMTPHISGIYICIYIYMYIYAYIFIYINIYICIYLYTGTSLSAQARYAAGTREMLECFFENRPFKTEYVIAQGGKLGKRYYST